MTSTHPHRHHKSTNVRLSFDRLAAAGLVRAFSWAPSVSASAALYLWSRPQRRARPAREESVREAGEPIRIPFGMGSLAGWRWGAGPTVLLVHGWEGRGSQLGAFVEPLVEAGYSVVSFDAPAHGDSGGDRASLIRFADAIDAAVRRVGPVHGIVAHSMGAAASLLAVTGGLPIERIVLVAPADPSRAMERFADAVGITEPVQDRIQEDLIEQYGARLSTYSAHALARGSATPALVIHDHDDRWVPISDGRAYTAGRPDFVLVETRGLGHHRILRDEGVVASTVRYLAGTDIEAVQVEASPPVAPVLEEPWTVGPIEVTEAEVMADLNYGR